MYQATPAPDSSYRRRFFLWLGPVTCNCRKDGWLNKSQLPQWWCVVLWISVQLNRKVMMTEADLERTDKKADAADEYVIIIHW